MNLYDYLYYVILPVLAISTVIIFIRFLKGPTLSDRVVSLDLLLTTGIGIIAVYSIHTDQPTFLDIAMILALIAFLGTVAFSYYLEKREKNE
ncbi:cation:proton antiporter [Lunatibacter salilacus]|uniref:cation:proton antiporter n=1 Tax=Lunatibacter salilacus TaxID=2483804 RepID=UPI00131B649A|nr:cation:proton antiporter [Lunatibacter salilacus]